MFSYIILGLSLVLNGWFLWKLHEVKTFGSITISPTPKPIIVKKIDYIWTMPPTLIKPVKEAVIEWREAA